MTNFARSRLLPAFVFVALFAVVLPAGADMLPPGGEDRARVVELEAEVAKRQQAERDARQAQLDAEIKWRLDSRAAEKRRRLALGASAAFLGVVAAARFFKAKR